MKASLTMDGPVESPLLEKTNRGIVGSSMNRPEGKLKVSGTATYAHEWNLPGTAFGVFVRAAIPKGRWTGIDRSSGLSRLSAAGSSLDPVAAFFQGRALDVQSGAGGSHCRAWTFSHPRPSG